MKDASSNVKYININSLIKAHTKQIQNAISDTWTNHFKL